MTALMFDQCRRLWHVHTYVSFCSCVGFTNSNTNNKPSLVIYNGAGRTAGVCKAVNGALPLIHPINCWVFRLWMAVSLPNLGYYLYNRWNCAHSTHCIQYGYCPLPVLYKGLQEVLSGTVLKSGLGGSSHPSVRIWAISIPYMLYIDCK